MEMIRAVEQERESYKTWNSHYISRIDDDTVFRKTAASTVRPTLPLHSRDATDEELEEEAGKRENTFIHMLKGFLGHKLEGFLGFQTDQMIQMFSRLLLGEDISGGGKSVSSALALSNAITNLSASVFGDQKCLEPMPEDRKERWIREIRWLLSVTDHIVEFSPIQQTNKDGSSMEVMTTRQRTDLVTNIPTLKKLDMMLIDCLDKFKDQDEFYYITTYTPESEISNDDKWWVPTLKVPTNGLSEKMKRFLLSQKEFMSQVLKTAMAINTKILSQMEIPESYIDLLPRNGRASLGDTIYRMMTSEMLDAEQFLLEMDLSSEHKILDLKNKIEASSVIWKRKMVQKEYKSSPWSTNLSMEKRQQLEEKADTILLLIKERYPVISQSALEISMIQFNKDIGLAILESYSRVLKSLAYTVKSRIEDVLEADQLTQDPKVTVCKRYIVREKDSPEKEETQGFCLIEHRPKKQKTTSYIESLGTTQSPTVVRYS